jgi:hypothetical protein
MLKPMVYENGTDNNPEVERRIDQNLYLSNITEEFIAMQVDLDIPAAIKILKAQSLYLIYSETRQLITYSYGG